MSVLIIEEKPPHFTDVEFEYKGIEFKAQICLLDTGKVMISFRVPKKRNSTNYRKRQNLVPEAVLIPETGILEVLQYLPGRCP